MYRVYCDDTLLYSDQAIEIKYKLIEATLTLEDCSAGSFEFTMSPQNNCYGKIEKMVSHITVYRDGEKLWGGRAVSEDIDFDRNITYFCEGELAYLNDTYQPLDEFHDLTLRQYIEMLLEVHNSKCDGNRIFTPIGNGPPDVAFETEENLFYGPTGTDDVWSGAEDDNPNGTPDYEYGNIFDDDITITDNRLKISSNSVLNHKIEFVKGSHGMNKIENALEGTGENDNTSYARYMSSRYHFATDFTYNNSAFGSETSTGDKDNELSSVYLSATCQSGADTRPRFKYRVLWRDYTGADPKTYSTEWKTDSGITIDNSLIPNVNNAEICVEVSRNTSTVIGASDLNDVNNGSYGFSWLPEKPTIIDNRKKVSSFEVLGNRILFTKGAHEFNKIENELVGTGSDTGTYAKYLSSNFHYAVDLNDAYIQASILSDGQTMSNYKYRLLWRDITGTDPNTYNTDWTMASTLAVNSNLISSLSNAEVCIQVARRAETTMSTTDVNLFNTGEFTFAWKSSSNTNAGDTRQKVSEVLGNRILFTKGSHESGKIENDLVGTGSDTGTYAHYLSSNFHYAIDLGGVYINAVVQGPNDSRAKYKYRILYRDTSVSGSMTKTTDWTVNPGLFVNDSLISNVSTAEICIEVATLSEGVVVSSNISDLNTGTYSFTWEQEDEFQPVGTRNVTKSLKLEPTYDESSVDSTPVLRATRDPEADYTLEIHHLERDGFTSIRDQIVNLTYTPTTFGNIDMNARPTIVWDKDNLAYYDDILSEYSYQSVTAGDEASLLPYLFVTSGYTVLYTPIIQSASGVKLVKKSLMNAYTTTLLRRATTDEVFSRDTFFDLDKKGLNLNGTFIHHAFADVAPNNDDTEIRRTAKLIKYVGLYGTINLLKERMKGVQTNPKESSIPLPSETSQYQNELVNFRADGYGSIEDQVVNMRYNTVFFNINMDARPSIIWTQTMKDRYADEINAWRVRDVIINEDVSYLIPYLTVYDGYLFFLTLIVQTANGSRLVSPQVMDSYIESVITTSTYGGVTHFEDIRTRDSVGLYIDGVYMHHVIGGVADVDNFTDVQYLTGQARLAKYVGRCGTLYRYRSNPEANGVLYSAHQSKKIYPGVITVSDEDIWEGLDDVQDTKIEYRYTYYESTLECIFKILDTIKGHIRVRTGDDGKLYLDFLKDYPNTNSQTINFGKNLLDYTQSYDLSNLCTALLPLGAKKDKSDLVGKPINVSWRLRSIITNTGDIFFGQNFYCSVKYRVHPKYRYTFVDAITGKVSEKTKQNYIKYWGEQVTGYIMYAFYDAGGNQISSRVASSSNTDKGTEALKEYRISIPSGNGDDLTFAFAYYMGSESSHVAGRIEMYREEGEEDIDTLVSTSNPGEILPGYWINTKTYNIEPILSDDYIVSDVIPVNDKDIYYYTARQNNGYGMYTIKDNAGKTIVSTTMASSGPEYTDKTKEKIECPIGARFLYLGALRGTGIDPILYNDGRRFSPKDDVQNYDPPEDYVTVKEVNNGSLYVENESLKSKYGWIERTIQWENIKTPTKLLQKAQDYMNKNSFDASVLEVKALDLHLLHVTTEAINLLDKVRCISAPHNLDKFFPVTKLEIPLLNPEEQTFTLGETLPESKITASAASSDSDIYRQLAEQPTPSAVLRSAKANATEIINQRSNGYVSVDPSEILIMDTPDKNTCTRLWRMNVNGIGYSSNGYYGVMDLAMTMDGEIVADRITTGYLVADRIRGGSLVLGGYNNYNGTFILKNSKGNRLVEMGAYEGVKIMGSLTSVTGVATPEEALQQAKQNFAFIRVNKGIISGGKAEVETEIIDETAVNAINSAIATAINNGDAASVDDFWRQYSDPTSTRVNHYIDDLKASKIFWDKYQVGFEEVKAYDEKTRIELYNVAGRWLTSESQEQYGIKIYANDSFDVRTGKFTDPHDNAAENQYNSEVQAVDHTKFLLNRDNFHLSRVSSGQIVAAFEYDGSDDPGFTSVPSDNGYGRSVRGKTLSIFNSASTTTDSDGHYMKGGVYIGAPNGGIVLDSKNLFVGVGTDGHITSDGFDQVAYIEKAVEDKTIILHCITDHTTAGITVKAYGIRIVNGIIVGINEITTADYTWSQTFTGSGQTPGGGYSDAGGFGSE